MIFLDRGRGNLVRPDLFPCFIIIYAFLNIQIPFLIVKLPKSEISGGGRRAGPGGARRGVCRYPAPG